MGFSLDICGTMLSASILRIFYYFNDPFEITLLRQCLVMVFIQTILLHFALKYRSEDAIHFEQYHSNWGGILDKFINLNREKVEQTFDEYYVSDNFNNFHLTNLILGVLMIVIRCVLVNVLLVIQCASQLLQDVVRLFDYHYIRPFNYWQWRNPITFWKYLFGFIAFLTVIQISFRGNDYLGICFGSISFMIESSLPLPQILLFQRVKSVENFKTILLLSWLGGDLTKISYLFYGTDNVGLIFIIAAFFQMSLNLVITYQFFYYKFNADQKYTEIPMTQLPVQSHTNASFVRSSVSRASSISLNKILNMNAGNTNVVPQSQHMQNKNVSALPPAYTMSQLNEHDGQETAGMDTVDDSMMNTSLLTEEDGISLADGVIGVRDQDDITRRATSIDAEPFGIVNGEGLGDGRKSFDGEEVRSRANTSHGQPGGKSMGKGKGKGKNKSNGKGKRGEQ